MKEFAVGINGTQNEHSGVFQVVVSKALFTLEPNLIHAYSVTKFLIKDKRTNENEKPNNLMFESWKQILQVLVPNVL